MSGGELQWRWLVVFCIEEGGCDDGGEEEYSESIRSFFLFFIFFFKLKLGLGYPFIPYDKINHSHEQISYLY